VTSSAAFAAPLVAVDRVIDVTPRSIRTVKAIAGNETFFPGHYPEFPIFPGVFVVEAVHQAVCLYAARQLAAPVPPRLVRLESVRFTASLHPGDVLEVDAVCAGDPILGDLTVDARCSRQDSPPVAVAQVRLRYRLER
jgi:3-hydroxyacyl-[acyl-carrier-protein] dehydratase